MLALNSVAFGPLTIPQSRPRSPQPPAPGPMRGLFVVHLWATMWQAVFIAHRLVAEHASVLLGARNTPECATVT